mgnify:CR=1 FL=1
MNIDEMKALHVLANLRRSLDEAGEVDRIGTLSMICDSIDDLRQGAPMPCLIDILDEALWWSGLASTVELEAYLAAIEKRLKRTELHEKARKRIVADMFSGMSDRDKAGFVGWAQKQIAEAEQNG